MASLPARPRYTCQSCIHQLSRRQRSSLNPRSLRDSRDYTSPATNIIPSSQPANGRKVISNSDGLSLLIQSQETESETRKSRLSQQCARYNPSRYFRRVVQDNSRFIRRVAQQNSNVSWLSWRSARQARKLKRSLQRTSTSTPSFSKLLEGQDEEVISRSIGRIARIRIQQPRPLARRTSGPSPVYKYNFETHIVGAVRPWVTRRMMLPAGVYYSTVRRNHGRGSITMKKEEGDTLTPSPPSQRIWAPERPTTHETQHRLNLEGNWYWETLPPTIAQKSRANHFFTKDTSPKFLRSVARFREFPESDVPEIAFVGRSNVGKSSLLNAIINADTNALLARTSSTPGFTKTMNLYGIGPANGIIISKSALGHDKIVGTGGLTIVDMPGYGEGSLSKWGVEIIKYLQSRKQLRRAFLLLDAAHGIKEKDRSLLALLRLAGIPHQIVLSKLDKLYLPEAREIKRFDGKKLSKLKSKGSLNKLDGIMTEIRNEIQPPVGGGALGEMLTCSSEVLVDGKRLGIDAVRFAMLQAIGFSFQPARLREIKEGELPLRTMKTN